jgi:hypothetical protein
MCCSLWRIKVPDSVSAGCLCGRLLNNCLDDHGSQKERAEEQRRDADRSSGEDGRGRKDMKVVEWIHVVLGLLAIVSGAIVLRGVTIVLEQAGILHDITPVSLRWNLQ